LNGLTTRRSPESRPYRQHQEREYTAALDLLGESPPALVVAQQSVRMALADSYGALRRTRVVTQGGNAPRFFSA
jgi:hypothetical protein